MSLPASQLRALNLIEKTLADDHPGLGPLFAIFTRLTGHEPMPVTERVTARRWQGRRMWPTVVTLFGLTMATGVLLTLSLLMSGPQVCVPSTVTAGAAHARSVPTGRQAACATQQNKLGQTSLSGLYAH